MDYFLLFAEWMWRIWPLLFVPAIETGLHRSKRSISRILIRLSLAWFFWLVLLVPLLLNGRTPEPFIPLIFYWIAGALLFGFLAWVEWGARSLQKRRNRLGELLSLSPEQFFGRVAKAYQQRGYQVQVLEPSGTACIDLLLTTPKGVRKAVLVRPGPGVINEQVVCAFYDAVQQIGAVEGAVICAGTFTRGARRWARRKKLVLYDAADLMKILKG